MFKRTAAAAIVAFVPLHHAPQHHRQGCHKLFTVPMTARAARAVYTGTRSVHERELRMLGRMEMCPRNPRAAWYVRWYDHHQAALWHYRRNTPSGWAIPWAIVSCESGGRNLPPNSAGASGYYQIIPSTWDGFDGYRAAYLAPKAVQDRRAAEIWRGGRGADQWVCKA